MSPRTRTLAAALIATLPVVLAVAPADAAVRRGDDRANTLVGTPRGDSMWGYGGADRLRAGGGDDALWGGAGKDRLNGGKGEDSLWGGGGNDTIDTGRDAREDRAWGGAGKDTIYVFGDDSAWGGGGNDRIFATYADDDLEVRCGAGKDVLVLNAPLPEEATVIGCETVKVVSAG
ncbi:calcium-binding protein [Nocardioides lijunqiniae]|uniref:calcium-binding protein n=1 Tax=Nocardioides lijunqiniae TaxID=2760832 RepID=UPI00187813DD|nr:calcium-binding protein [Nocardioides lijunqiniae]